MTTRSLLTCTLAALLMAAGITVGFTPEPAIAAPRRFADRDIVTDLTRLHVYKRTGIEQRSLRVRVEALRQGYARTRVTSPGIDPASVYLKKIGRAWKVIAGPGTAFSAWELKRLGIPRSVR